MARKKQETETDILFPEKVLKFGDIQVTMSPLPLDKLGMFANAFVKILDAVSMGETPSRIAVTCISEVLGILPYCLDVPLAKLPATAFPDLLIVFFEQNVTEDVVDRFLYLMTEKVKTLSENISKRLAVLGETSTF